MGIKSLMALTFSLIIFSLHLLTPVTSDFQSLQITFLGQRAVRKRVERRFGGQRKIPRIGLIPKTLGIGMPFVFPHVYHARLVYISH